MLINIFKDENMPEGEVAYRGDSDTDSHTPTNDWVDHLPRLRLPSLTIDQLSARNDLRAISKQLLSSTSGLGHDQYVQFDWDITNADTQILPIAPSVQVTNITGNSQQGYLSVKEDHVSVLHNLIRKSAIYALSSMASPLISLVLAPFLTHNLSPSDYAILTITNIAISLLAGITQMGLASAFFRAYSYDYTSQKDRRDVVATATTLLCLTSTLIAIVVAILASAIANLLFGQSTFGNYVIGAGVVVLLQNLTVPGMAWLRAEGRPLFYSLLSISNLVVTLLANIFLLGMLHWGVSGSIIANGCGYACIVICTLPIIILRAGIKIRTDIVRNLLSFGLPLVLNFVSYWVLQLSDRYLLGLFTSLTEAARYAVVYTLGSAISVLVMGPFALAWPTALFAIAKRKDAVQVFRLLFRWFSIFLLFAAFGLSLAGKLLLDWLFPETYHSAAFVIPIVALSIAFYGVYYIFIVGVNVKHTTWLISIFMAVAALTNIGLNLILIPRYGAIGAALSTLFAYIVLAIIAYIVNQRLYPIPFEVGIFTIALVLGIALYTGSDFLTQKHETIVGWIISIGALGLYSVCLAFLGMFPTWVRRKEHREPRPRDRMQIRRNRHEA